ncbi:MAG: hypothetical protein CM15mV72_410 [uncultured marine virus]|nr:MAG: hypothetical protein CM15mV72_410 [uncultured marine virus]
MMSINLSAYNAASDSQGDPTKTNIKTATQRLILFILCLLLNTKPQCKQVSMSGQWSI